MAGKGPRMTEQTQDVLTALLAEPSTPLYGFEIAQTTELAVGTVYPVLRRLVDAGWLTDFMESAVDAEAEGRPRRRYYQLTGVGAARANNALVEAQRRRARIALGVHRGTPAAEGLI